MLLTVKLRVQQGVNIYQFKVDNMYCQLKEIMDSREKIRRFYPLASRASGTKNPLALMIF